MKRYLTWPVVAVTLLAAASAGLAKPVSSSIALRATAKANAGRHIGMKSGGGLILGSTVLTNKEIFTLIDLNGGALQDGDPVQISTGGKRPTYWQETKGKVNRIGGRPNAACLFKVKWKQKNKSLMLRAASGKYVSGPGKGKDVVTIAKAGDPTTVFDFLKNPKPAPKRPAVKRPAVAKKAAAR